MELDRINPFQKDMSIIRKLEDEPNDVGGLTATELKAKFDEGGDALKEYINGTLIPGIEALLNALNEYKAEKSELQDVVLGQIPDGTITTEKLADESVTTGKVADESITTAKVADGAVTKEKLDAVLQEEIESHATKEALDDHIKDAGNPHKVTAGQVSVSEVLAQKLGVAADSAFVESALSALGDDLQGIHDSVSSTEDAAKIAQVQYGSYVGTGTYGSANPCTLTFDFRPLLVILSKPSSPYAPPIFLRGMTSAPGIDPSYKPNISWGNNWVSWYYTTSAESQGNVSGQTYYYLAIG